MAGIHAEHRRREGLSLQPDHSRRRPLRGVPGSDMPSGIEAIRSFGQFRQFVAFIAAKRDVGELLEPFDLLDFDGYDKNYPSKTDRIKRFGFI